MNESRYPAVAGSFYPEDPAALDQLVRHLLLDASVQAPEPGLDTLERPSRIKALIVPHAGYVYSGPVAATAYARLRAQCSEIRSVILIGPSHHVAFSGLALSGSTRFVTPLGSVTIDRRLEQRLLTEVDGVSVLPRAHAHEHSLEVHLPFLQSVLDDFELVPLVVGDASTDVVAAVLDLVWGGHETLIVASSDLSHYHPFERARQIDAATADSIVAASSSLRSHQACGCRAINGLLAAVRRRTDLRVEPLDIRNSGDTSGGHDRVVGYGAFAVLEPVAAGDQ